MHALCHTPHDPFKYKYFNLNFKLQVLKSPPFPEGTHQSLDLYCTVCYRTFSVLICGGYKTIRETAYICIYFLFHTSSPCIFSSKSIPFKINLLEKCVLATICSNLGLRMAYPLILSRLVGVSP